MRTLVTAPRGKTGQRVIAALQKRDPSIAMRGICRTPVEIEGVEVIVGDMDDPATRRHAVDGVDVIIHYAPPMHPRETSMGTGMIDAAIAAGVRRFVYISVINPQIDDLINHKAKLAVEANLINSDIEWTILRPQHYFQNIDVRQAVSQGGLMMPYPPATRLGHVDMNDLAEATALIATESGHVYASYDISSGEHLSVEDLCAQISAISGALISPVQIEPEDVVRHISAHRPLTAYSVEAFHRLFGYYARRGIQGNPNVLTWLLGRAPGTFSDYCARSLAGQEGRTGNAG